MPEAPMPQGGAAPSPDAGQGPAEKIASLNEALMSLADETSQAEVPEEAKAALAEAVGAYQKFMASVAGEAPAEGPSQTVSAEGGVGGVPMNHGGRA